MRPSATSLAKSAKKARSIGATQSTKATWRVAEGVRIWAHRGASNAVTENTIAAFERAVTDGADAVELDVRLAKTGEVMVFHDDTLARLAMHKGSIERMAYRDIARVSLVGGHQIPLLDHALEACGDLRVNVELKVARNAGPLAEAVAKVVARHRPARILVSSFSVPGLQAMAERAPAVARAFLTEAPVTAATLAQAARLGAVAIHPWLKKLTEASVEAMHRKGFAVNVFTVDQAADLHRLGAWRPDGVFTNCPVSARAVLLPGSI